MSRRLIPPDPLRVVLADANVIYSQVLREYPDRMIAVHTTSVERLPGATDASTIAALDRAGAPEAAAKMRYLLELDRPRGLVGEKSGGQDEVS